MREALSVEEARRRLGDVVTRAAADGAVTVITKNGVPAAAVVPLALLRRIDQDDDQEGSR
ncbi:MAG: type II toxin-antitoxin system Phd/YefM family antitoxin [Actinomycetota bacterium]|nr:type II toxin-antitoxin system Phd/YefM family antitoxin [Actinomycetota bacterium]